MAQKKLSRQMQWYHANKKRANDTAYAYRKKMMTIGRYAIKRKLIDEKTLKRLTKFIFQK